MWPFFNFSEKLILLMFLKVNINAVIFYFFHFIKEQICLKKMILLAFSVHIKSWSYLEGPTEIIIYIISLTLYPKMVEMIYNVQEILTLEWTSIVCIFLKIGMYFFSEIVIVYRKCLFLKWLFCWLHAQFSTKTYTKFEK